MEKNKGKKSNKPALFRRYLKLFNTWNIIPVEIKITDVADVLSCTPRYARTLLKEMSKEGWLSWASGQGRGATGHLHCFINQYGLSVNNSKNEKLKPSQGTSKLNDKNANQINSACLYIPFYRPLSPIIPSVNIGRPERHLISMVHAGLTKMNDDGELQADIAHYITSDDTKQTWCFFLRNNLIWHDGTPASPDELFNAILKHTKHASLEHIVNLELKKNTLKFKLSRPDVLFAHRLANPVFSIAKPKNEEIGLGSYRIVTHSDSSLILERSLYCHRALPQIHKIEYKIRPRKPEKWKTMTILTDDQEDKLVSYINNMDYGFQFLAFNENCEKLSTFQKQTIRIIARECTKKISNNEGILPTTEQFTPFPEIISETILPPSLEMGYFWTPDNEKWCKIFKKYLMYYKCNLKLNPISSAHWFLPYTWEVQDLALSGMLLDKVSWLYPEFRLKSCVMLKTFMQKKNFNRMNDFLNSLSNNEVRYKRNIKRLVHLLIHNHWIEPLFSLEFKVLASQRIQGISVSSQGWPDFTKLWITDVEIPKVPQLKS